MVSLILFIIMATIAHIAIIYIALKENVRTHELLVVLAMGDLVLIIIYLIVELFNTTLIIP